MWEAFRCLKALHLTIISEIESNECHECHKIVMNCKFNALPLSLILFQNTLRTSLSLPRINRASSDVITISGSGITNCSPRRIATILR